MIDLANDVRKMIQTNKNVKKMNTKSNHNKLSDSYARQSQSKGKPLKTKP